MSSPLDSLAPDGEVCVVGAGVVGATAGYTLATTGVDVTFVDADPDLAEAHATDVRHAVAHAGHPAGRGLPTPRVESGGPAAAADADCLVFAASVPRPEGARSRMAFLEPNREVVADVAGWLGDLDPRPLVVVTNPLDRIVHLLYERLGWPRHRLVGYSLSETARVTDAVARLRDCSPAAVSLPVVGEHGDGLVPLFSRLRIDGAPIELTDREREEVLEYARTVALSVIDKRGFDETSRWVSGRGVALLCRAILAGGTDDPLGLCTPLDGEYGETDVSLGVPVTLSGAGVERVHEWELAPEERERLHAAADDVRSSL